MSPLLNILRVQVQNLKMANLGIGCGLGWPLKGFGPELSTYQVAAHFKALYEGVLMAPLKSFECHSQM